MIIVSQLGDSFPDDAFVEEQLARRLHCELIRYGAVIAAFGARSNDIERRCARLRAFLERMAGDDVVILGRSSGARVATLVACENIANVRGVIAFGYPFKHPKSPHEDARVAHLAHLSVPTLLFQGVTDRYGGEEEIGTYALSPTVEVELLPTGHGIKLSRALWDQVGARIGLFLAGL